MPSGRISAQANLQFKANNAINFEKLSDEDKRLWLQARINESSLVILTHEFQEQIKLSYKSAQLDERVYTKYLSLLKVLMNEAIILQNRIALSKYLLANFSEDEIPHELLREIMYQLQTQTVK